MDKDLKELQEFANDLNQLTEDCPSTAGRHFLKKNKIFKSGTKKINKKIGTVSNISIVITSDSAKKE